MTKRPLSCEYPGCNSRSIFCKGMCELHYRKNRRQKEREGTWEHRPVRPVFHPCICGAQMRRDKSITVPSEWSGDWYFICRSCGREAWVCTSGDAVYDAAPTTPNFTRESSYLGSIGTTERTYHVHMKDVHTWVHKSIESVTGI